MFDAEVYLEGLHKDTWGFVGQNLAAGVTSWERAIWHWIREKENWKYGEGKIDPNGLKVGHFETVRKASITCFK